MQKTKLWFRLVWQTSVALLRRFEVDRAVLFSVLSQVWSVLAGPVTMLLIAYWLSAVEQGYYFTFSSVLSLQVFVELGLVTVIVQVASHEWAFLQRDATGRIHGDSLALSRLASLLRYALKWYMVSGLVAMVGLSVGGYCFFAAKPHPGITWEWAWFALCVVAGIALIMSPIFSVIEGCNQVESIYGFRLLQGVLNSLAVMISVVLGFGLYSLAAAALVRFAWGVAYIVWRQRQFVRQLLTLEITTRIDWWTEVWPFQWRIGVSWLSGFFIFSVFTPIMFYYHGAQVAGQMGMTWALVLTIELVANAWISTRLPQFGMLIARMEYEALDQLFQRLFWITMLVSLICSVGVLGFIYWLKQSGLSLAERLLPLLPAALLIAQRILNVAVSAMAFYLRAHKKEVMMIPSVTWAVLAGLSTWILGAQYGAMAAAAGFLAVTIIWGVPSTYYVYNRYRKLWHGSPVRHAPI